MKGMSDYIKSLHDRIRALYSRYVGDNQVRGPPHPPAQPHVQTSLGSTYTPEPANQSDASQSIDQAVQDRSDNLFRWAELTGTEVELIHRIRRFKDDYAFFGVRSNRASGGMSSDLRTHPMFSTVEQLVDVEIGRYKLAKRIGLDKNFPVPYLSSSVEGQAFEHIIGLYERHGWNWGRQPFDTDFFEMLMLALKDRGFDADAYLKQLDNLDQLDH